MASHEDLFKQFPKESFDRSLDGARRALDLLAGCSRLVSILSDSDLLRIQRELSDLARGLGASAAVVAGEIGHRSRRELGYAGLAQREGFRTPEALIRHETGSTARNASALVQVGTMARDSSDVEALSSAEPWFREVGAAVAAGNLSVDAARAIRIGLGVPSERAGAVTPDDLVSAAHFLVIEAAHVDADELLRRARSARDDLDEAGIADRERAAFEERSVRRTRRPMVFRGTSSTRISSPPPSGTTSTTRSRRLVAGAFASLMTPTGPGSSGSHPMSEPRTSMCTTV